MPPKSIENFPDDRRRNPMALNLFHRQRAYTRHPQYGCRGSELLQCVSDSPQRGRVDATFSIYPVKVSSGTRIFALPPACREELTA